MISDWDDLERNIVQCRLCPRLVEWREKIAAQKRRAFQGWTYWGKPVPGFGDPNARILVVGLAPGAHGSNRTGRMFTGDSSGDFLYAALHRFGFASQPVSTRPGDGLSLADLFISALCRCAPPDNKPTLLEINTCQPYLEKEIALLDRLEGIVALGRLAFERVSAIYRARGASVSGMVFRHGAFFELGNRFPWVLASYHPSRQNTQTGRLRVEMFDSIWAAAREKLIAE